MTKPSRSDKSIDDRLTKLEQQHCWTKRGVLLVGLLFGVAALSGQARPAAENNEVVAESFRLIDQDGKTRAVLTMDHDGPMFLLKSPDEQTRGGMALVYDDSRFIVFDERIRINTETGNPVFLTKHKP